MRKSEMTVGGEYALAEYDGQRPDRVRIVEFNAPRHYSSARDYRGHTSKDGILVELLNRETGETLMATRTVKSEPTEEQVRIAKLIGSTPIVTERTEQYPVRRVVISRHIKDTWENASAAAKAMAERKAAIARNRAQRELQLKDFKAALTEAGLITYDHQVEFKYDRHSHTVNTGTVELPFAVLATLIEKAGL